MKRRRTRRASIVGYASSFEIESCSGRWFRWTEEGVDLLEALERAAPKEECPVVACVTDREVKLDHRLRGHLSSRRGPMVSARGS